MNELIAKLMNLSYELFGVVLPGLFFSLLLLLVWVAVGPATENLTLGAIPAFTATNFQQFLDALSIASGISITVPLFVIWYFLGHILLWFARTGPRLKDCENTGKHRVCLVLTMRIPKLECSYDSKLSCLLPKVYSAFELREGAGAEWRVLYPVAKCYLSRRLPNSLVSTYQNKYTFHRSVAASAAIAFWLTLAALIGSFAVLISGGPSANWLLLFVLLVLSVAIAWGFSGSYLYHWQMFGNTIITETYSLACGPDYVKPSDKEPVGD